MDTPSFKGDLLVYQNEWCPGTTNGVGGITLVDVTQPELAEEARRGRRRLHQEGRHAVQRRPADARQPDALRLRVDEQGDRQGLRRPRRRHGGARRRHPRHHQPLQAEDRLRDQPRPVRADRPDAAARRLRVQPRHDRQAHRRPRHHADVLLGRRLRHARRERTRPARSRCRTPTSRPPTRRARSTARRSRPRATATRRSSPATTSSSSPPTRTSTPTACRPPSRAARRPARRSPPSRVGDTGRSTRTTRSSATRAFLGLGCDPLAPAARDKIAVAERGMCDFQVKLDNIEAAGYKGLIVFNRTRRRTAARRWSRCSPRRTTTPAIFVSRKDGFRLLGVEPAAGYTCGTDVRDGRHGHAAPARRCPWTSRPSSTAGATRTCTRPTSPRARR